jgi:hypothetical protein
MGKSASADTPAMASTPVSGSGRSSGGDTAAPDKADDTAASDTTATPADAAAAVDEDDDWPTRYSWLDEEPANGEASDDADLDDHSAQLPSAAEPATPGDSGTPDTETLDTGTPDTGTPDITASELSDANAAENADADVAAPAVPGDSEGLSPVDDLDPGAGEADKAESEPPAAPAAADAATGTGLVAVIRGVPRYHEPDCVLIRFMPEGDSQKLSVAQAKELGCTPCAACQPEG